MQIYFWVWLVLLLRRLDGFLNCNYMHKKNRLSAAFLLVEYLVIEVS